MILTGRILRILYTKRKPGASQQFMPLILRKILSAVPGSVLSRQGKPGLLRNSSGLT